MIEASSLSFRYPKGPSLSFPDIRCDAGDRLLILGESGTGKSTLLQLLAGLRQPSTGSIRIHGTSLGEVPARHRDRFRGRHIGLVFQTPHFLQALTVEQNIALAQHLAGQERDTLRIHGLLEKLGLSHRLQAYPRHCSQGEQQRISIARALINQPDILLADEPTSSLDDRHCHEVLHLLEEQAAACRSALIIVTHDHRIREQIPHTITLERHV